MKRLHHSTVMIGLLLIIAVLSLACNLPFYALISDVTEEDFSESNDYLSTAESDLTIENYIEQFNGNDRVYFTDTTTSLSSPGYGCDRVESPSGTVSLEPQLVGKDGAPEKTRIYLDGNFYDYLSPGIYSREVGQDPRVVDTIKFMEFGIFERKVVSYIAESGFPCFTSVYSEAKDSHIVYYAPDELETEAAATPTDEIHPVEPTEERWSLEKCQATQYLQIDPAPAKLDEYETSSSKVCNYEIAFTNSGNQELYIQTMLIDTNNNTADWVGFSNAKAGTSLTIPGLITVWENGHKIYRTEIAALLYAKPCRWIKNEPDLLASIAVPLFVPCTIVSP